MKGYKRYEIIFANFGIFLCGFTDSYVITRTRHGISTASTLPIHLIQPLPAACAVRLGPYCD